MEIVGKEEFDDVELTEEDVREIANVPMFSDKDIADVVDTLDKPVERQKELAAKIHLFLDKKMKEQLEEGFLSDSVRRWVTLYNHILDQIQKSVHGGKSVNLHLHKVSHSLITEQVRKYSKDEEKANK